MLSMKKSFIDIVRFITNPLVNKFGFFVISFLLQVIPVIMYSYYNCDSIFYFDCVRLKTFVFSFPYIVFMPFVFSYFCITILYLLERINRVLSLICSILFIFFLSIISFVNIFLLVHFQTMLTPSMIQLFVETNNSESIEFFSTYFLMRRSLYVLFYVILFGSLFVLLRHYKFTIVEILNKIRVRFICSILVVVLFVSSISQFNLFLKLFMSKTTSDIEMWYGNTFNPEVSIMVHPTNELILS